MSAGRITPWAIATVLVIVLAGVTGWAIGAGSANGKGDTRSARDEGYSAGYDLVFEKAFRATSSRGLKEGASRGSRAGEKTGSREGKSIGAGNAAIEEAVNSQKDAEAAASSAESEIAARQANCGIVPAAPSWCPTSEELSAYREAVKAAKEEAGVILQTVQEEAEKAAKEAEKQQQQQQQQPGQGNGIN